MKISILSKALILGFVLAVAAVGCKKTPKNTTMLPSTRSAATAPSRPPVDNPMPALPPGGTGAQQLPPTGNDVPPVTSSGIPPTNLEDFGDMLGDPEKFKNETVYFDFDRAEVKPSEKAKIETVAAFLKANPTNKLQVDGHCDERGTEEYNRSLGERRALSVREYLVSLSIGADRVRTLSYGEDKPAVPGHDDAAWSKNRRGEFILLLPKP